MQGSVADEDARPRARRRRVGRLPPGRPEHHRLTKDPREDFATNIGGTLNVLLAARDSQGRPHRLHRLHVDLRQPADHPDQRGRPAVPLSPYAVSKLGGEHYCLAFYESYGLPVSVVRYSNVFGIGQRPDNPYCGVIAKFFAAAIEGKPLQIHGDGEQTRDYTYIDDAVDATLLAAIRPRAEGEVFNVGTGIETSVNDLALMIGEAVGVEVDIVHIDRRDIDNIRRRVVNIEKARRMLRWAPQVTLADRPRPDGRLDALVRLRRAGHAAAGPDAALTGGVSAATAPGPRPQHRALRRPARLQRGRGRRARAPGAGRRDPHAARARRGLRLRRRHDRSRRHPPRRRDPVAPRPPQRPRPGRPQRDEGRDRRDDGPLVLISMADGSDEPHIVDRMVGLARDGADVVAASRYMRGGHQVGGPLLKRLMSRTAGLSLHWVAGVPTHDPTNNFKLYRRSFLDATPIESEAGFELALELTVKATLAGRRVAEVPTTWRDRTAGQSNFQLRKWLPHYLRWYLVALRGRLRPRKARPTSAG